MNVKFARSIAVTIGTLAVAGCWKSTGDAIERNAESSRLRKVAYALPNRGNVHVGDLLRELLALHESPREGLQIVRRSEATGNVGETIVLYEHVELGIGRLPIVAEVWDYDADNDPTGPRDYSVMILYSTGDYALRGFTKEELLLFLAIEDPEEAADWLDEYQRKRTVQKQ